MTRFQADSYFETEEFRDEYKLCLFHYLLPYLGQFRENGNVIKLSPGLKERRDDYMREGDDLYMWFCSKFEFTGNKDNVVKMRDVYRQYVPGSHFKSLSKAEQRKCNQKNFQNELLKRKVIAKCFVRTIG